MIVCEIFASIQGESTLQGLPTVFIRLTGCNLDCRYCDTRYARENGDEMSIDAIIDKISLYNITHVCITGGEPLVQSDTPLLATILSDRGYIVSVETNGSIDTTPLPDSSIRVIDIKTPGSGESETIHASNIAHIRDTDEFKFVITNREDFEYSVSFSKQYLSTVPSPVLFSPAYDIIDPGTVSEWILEEYPRARLNLQLHKYIWPADIDSERPR